MAQISVALSAGILLKLDGLLIDSSGEPDDDDECDDDEEPSHDETATVFYEKNALSYYGFV